MVVGKIGGITGSSYVRPIVRRLATDQIQGDVFVLRGIVVFVDLAQRRFALRQDQHAYNVGWVAGTEFIGTDAGSMRGVEVCVKGRIRSADLEAELVSAV